MTFKEFFKLCEFATNLNVPLSTVIPSSPPFGAVGYEPMTPQTFQDPAPVPPNRGALGLEIPQIPVTGTITAITGPGQQQHGEPEQDGRKNLVQITLDGGAMEPQGAPMPPPPQKRKTTHIYLTWDEFKRIKGEVGRGKKMTVVFQRHPSDKSRLPSQIQSITVH
jgi:hypothetical protein